MAHVAAVQAGSNPHSVPTLMLPMQLLACLPVSRPDRSPLADLSSAPPDGCECLQEELAAGEGRGRIVLNRTAGQPVGHVGALLAMFRVDTAPCTSIAN